MGGGHKTGLRKESFIKTLFVPRVQEGPLSVQSLYFMYNIWQDAGIRAAARCATNELHTSLERKDARSGGGTN